MVTADFLMVKFFNGVTGRTYNTISIPIAIENQLKTKHVCI